MRTLASPWSVLRVVVDDAIAALLHGHPAAVGVGNWPDGGVPRQGSDSMSGLSLIGMISERNWSFRRTQRDGPGHVDLVVQRMSSAGTTRRVMTTRRLWRR